MSYTDYLFLFIVCLSNLLHLLEVSTLDVVILLGVLLCLLLVILEWALLLSSASSWLCTRILIPLL